MNVLHRAAITMAIALPLGAVPLTAQRYHWDFGVNGGYSWLRGNLFDHDDFDFITDGVTTVDVNNDVFDVNHRFRLDNGGTAGATLGYWFGDSRFGIRGNFAWTGSGLDGRRFIFTNTPFDFINHNINLWSLTGDLMVHLTTPRRKWDGFEWLPYIALGAGATWVDPENSDFRLIDDFTLVNPLDTNIDVGGRNVLPITCNDFNIITNVPSCLVLRNNTRFTGLGALGMDFRFSPHFAGKLEGGDRIWKSSVERVFVDPDFPFFVVDSGDRFHKTVNQLYVVAGVSYLWGLEHPPVQHAVARPAPPPPPPPPPPPSTEEITVCVVDPTNAQGLRMMSATRNLQTGDTTVTQNGQTMPLSSAVANIPTAGNAQWYISGAPLTIGVAPKQLQYTAVGGSRMITIEQLAYIGTIGGVPVFADRTSISPVLTNLGPNTDLNALLMQAPNAKSALETVPVLYVPLQPTGCVFQAMQKMQEVRKNKELDN